MPGVCGVISKLGVSAADVQAMTGILSRQPWHSASHEAGAQFAFGHVSVQGSSSARTSAVVSRGPCTAVFDGELYGQEAEGREDHARVFLDGVLDRGPEFLRTVHGCFSAALWNGELGTLTLITDRFGLRPVFWRHVQDRFSFASEVGALMAGSAPETLSRQGIAEFLSFGQLLGDSTLYETVKAAPAAAWIVFDTRQGTLDVRQYASWTASTTSQPENYWVDAVDAALAASVERVSRRSNHLGLSLSGGLDARTVLGVLPSGVRATCVSLGIPGSIDLRAARAMAEATGQKFVAHALNGDFLGQFEPLLRQMVALSDGHYLDQGIVLTTLPLYRSLGIDALLRGHAGELMHMSKAYAFSVDDHALRLRNREELLDWLWTHLTGYMIGSVDPGLFSTEMSADIRDRARAALERSVDALPEAPATQRIWHLFVTERVRREIAASLQVFRSFVEVRVPFLDPELVQLLLDAPVEMKIGATLQSEILERRCPALLRIVNANTGAPMTAGPRRQRLSSLSMRVLAKLGVPGYQPYERLGLWLARDLHPFLRATLLDERFLDRRIFERAAVERLLDEHRERRKNHTYLLQALLVFELGQRLRDSA
jgi:asparagine synthase (glutamine-hydrolysing)